MAAAGGSFVAISPLTQTNSGELVGDRGYKFPILRDEANSVAGEFTPLNHLPDDLKQLYLGMGLDLVAANGEDSWTLPIPGSFVIDTGGVIRYANSDADYTRRPEPDETLAALQALS